MINTSTRSSHACVLIVDCDGTIAETFVWSPRLRDFQVVSARSGLDGLEAARGGSFDLLLVDLRLPDMPGLDLVRTLRAERCFLPFMVVSGYMTVSVAVEAMQLGALTVLEKPIDTDQLANAVRNAISNSPGTSAVHLRELASLFQKLQVNGKAGGPLTEARSTAHRWASLVLRVLDSGCDPKTVENWARAVSVSRSALCECCRLVHVSPHDARDFARMMRAIAHCGDRWQPEAVMDFADARTLTKLLRRGGLLGETRTPTLDDFLDRQQLIPHDNPGLAAVRVLIRHRHGNGTSTRSSD